VERHDDRVDWLAGLERVSGSAAIGPHDTLSSWRTATAGLHLPNNGVAARFGSPEQAEFPHGQRHTAGSLVATIATRAGVLVLPEPEQEATLGRIRVFPREQTGDHQRRVHPPDTDRHTARPAAVKAINHPMFT
jgi:hypothetical protein